MKPSDRVESPTPFGPILERLLAAVAGARAAVIVDREGEAVDYAGAPPALEIKLAGAHFRVVLDEATARLARAESSPHHLSIRADKRSFFVRPLPDGYALVIVLARRALGISPRALSSAERELAEEAGWLRAPTWHSWYPVTIRTTATNRRRPRKIRGAKDWEPVVVLGVVVGLEHEQGYRCRLPSGVELTLVREATGRWYADELVEASTSAEDAPRPLQKGRSR